MPIGSIYIILLSVYLFTHLLDMANTYAQVQLPESESTSIFKIVIICAASWLECVCQKPGKYNMISLPWRCWLECDSINAHLVLMPGIGSIYYSSFYSTSNITPQIHLHLSQETRFIVDTEYPVPFTILYEDNISKQPSPATWLR